MGQRNKYAFSTKRGIVISITVVLAALVLMGCTSGNSGALENPTLANSEPAENPALVDQFDDQPEETKDLPIPVNPTSFPEPAKFQGVGDQIIEIPQELTIGGIIHAVHNGSGEFVVRGMDMFGDTTDTFFNTSGAYNGKRLYFQLDAEDLPTRQFSIETEGEWEITIYPFAEEYVTLVDLPGEYTGGGEDVIFLQPPGAKLTANATGDSQFIVWANHTGTRTLVFDEIAPFTGTIDLPYQTVILEILTDSSFSLEISD